MKILSSDILIELTRRKCLYSSIQQQEFNSQKAFHDAPLKSISHAPVQR